MAEAISDIGNFRDINEDYLGFTQHNDEKLYVIADGMGGHNAGEVASKLAVDTLVNGFKNEFIDEEDTIRSLIVAANEKIYELSHCKEDYNGMGTTITACIIKGNKVTIGNVGDSSLYIIKNNIIKKVTKDNSYVQELLDKGKISMEEAKNHPNKNLITRALGTASSIQVDIYKLSSDGIKYILLCTDGLSNEIEPFEIYEIINNNNAKEACHLLVEKAKANGGRDNISLILVEGDE
ncbi:MAG: Stp1/IreP family PP2C-type Ser/Thr phosphatase [Bacillota bacterium]|nr:Stp1/IreP family PP2C-type Ser/Thr phosphatase [Bacillota bacterium]